MLDNDPSWDATVVTDGKSDPERETLKITAAGAAVVLGARHSATRAFARAAATMAKVNLWHARLAMKTLRLDQREAIAEAVEGVGQAEEA